jgi:hypothetical protein
MHAMRIGVRLGLLGLLVTATGCAFGQAEATGDVAEEAGTEEVGAITERVVSGWSSWSTSAQSVAGGQVGCHSGSLIAGVERKGSSTRILCEPAGTINTDSYWMPWINGPTISTCRDPNDWVTGYQSASWQMGSGFRLRCSKITDSETNRRLVPLLCGWQQATNSSGPSIFPSGSYLTIGTCGSNCGALYWQSCTALR